MHIHDLRKLIKANQIKKGRYYTLDNGEVYIGVSNFKVDFVRKDKATNGEDVQDAIGEILEDSDTIALRYVDGPPSIKATLISFSGFTTDDLNEGVTNLYFTNARARLAISETITGIDYNNTTGVFSLTAGYEIPTSAALAGFVSGTGANNRIALWSGASTQDSDANFTWDGSDLIVGNTVATLAGEIASFRKDQNAATWLAVVNTTSNTAARVGIVVSQSATGATPNITMQILSPLFTTTGLRVANTGIVQSNASGGLGLGTNTAAPIRFWTNDVQVGEFTSGGFFGIGTTPTVLFDALLTQNAATTLRAVNSNASGASRVLWQASNGTSVINIEMLGTGFTTAGGRVANQGNILTNGVNGLLIGANNAAATEIGFYLRGTATTNLVTRMTNLGIGFFDGVPTAAIPIYFSQTLNNQNGFVFENPSTGTAGRSFIGARNSAQSIFIEKFSTGYTTAGLLTASLGRLYNNTGDTLIGTASGDTIFATGGTATTNERFRIGTSALTVADAINFVFNTTTGTKLGTATSQKIGVWNATPIVQPTTGIAAATFVANTSLIANDTATFDGYTIGQVVKALRNIGLLA